MLQNNIDNEFISKLIKEQPLGDAFSVKKTEEDATDDIQKVRYLGGEEVKDSNGETITEEKRSIIPPFNKKEVPLTRKKGEPENAQELSQDIRKEMDSGSSFNEAWEKEMKKYPSTAKNINEFYDLNGNIEYHKEYPYTNGWHTDNWGAESVYTPKEAVEVENLKNLGISSLLDKDSSFIYPNEKVSLPATRLYQYLVKNKALDEWQDVMTNFNPSKFLRTYNALSKAINEDKDKEFTADEKTDIKMLLNETMRGYAKRLDEVNKKEEKAKTPKPETRGSFTTADGKTTDVKYPTVATLIDKNGNEAVKQEEKTSKKTDEVKEEISAEPKTEKVAGTEPKVEMTPASLEEDQVLAEAEKTALETENLIKADNKNAEEREKAKQRIDKIDKEIEDAAARKRQDQFDYEEWLKNPTLISGIFGHSGLSIAKRIGLGTAALFAIFSDVAASYAKGINNVTDFKTAALDELNSTIKTIQDERAKKIGEMAGKPYTTTAENEEKLNKDYEKLRRTYAGTYIPEDTLKAFIQESQLDTTEPISDELYEYFTNESRKGFIDSVKKNKKLKKEILDSDDNLTPEGEVRFLKKQAQALNTYKNALNISGERMANIENRLALERERAETRARVHDVYFQNNMDYINAINNMEAENQALVAAKLDFTEKKTLDAMQESVKKFRDTISGLATSTSSAASTESEQAAILNNFTEQKGLEKVNEELKKHGFEAEINAHAGAKIPIKVVPLSAEVSGGGKWTNEQANKYVESEYERFTNNYQRSANAARSLSNASGENIDRTYEMILNFLNTEKAKGASADYDAARKNILDAIDRKIEYNSSVIDELKDMKSNEKRFDTSVDDESASTSNPYVSMFNSVPTKNAEWYKRMLSLT